MDNKEENQIDKVIEEIKERQKFSLMDKKKTINEIHLDEERALKEKELEREQLLDKEIEDISEAIRKSNPKWILDNFEEFVYKSFDKKYNTELIEVKIADKSNAKKLMMVLSKLKDKDKENNFIKIIWDNDIAYEEYSKELMENKVLQLIEGWVFYANTQIDYKNLKFTDHERTKKEAKEDFIYFILAIIVIVGIPIAIIVGLIWWIISIF